MASPSIKRVVVWQWLNDDGNWRSYDPQVSNHIEAAYGKQDEVPLGPADINMSPYRVDLKSHSQVRMSTGMLRPVRRELYKENSPLGKGITWEWANDSGTGWLPYPTGVSQHLEDAYARGDNAVDLSRSQFKMPYSVDFSSMTQIRNNTRTKRTVRRYTHSKSYTQIEIQDLTGSPSASNSASVTSASRSGASAVSVPAATVPVMNGHVAMAASMPAVASSAPAKGGSGSHWRKHMTRQFLSLMKGGATSAAPAATSSSPSTHSVHPSSSTSASASGSMGYSHSSKPSYSGHKSRPRSSKHPRKRSRLSTEENVLVLGEVTPEQDLQQTLQEYTSEVTDPPAEDCCICCELLSDPSGYCDGDDEVEDGKLVYKLDKCQHMYHGACIAAMYESGTKDGSLQCPTCKETYGVKFGNCPPGQMEVLAMPNQLPGYTCGTLMVVYHIPPGIQGQGHPHPGQPYTTRGFPRRGFFPNNDEGQKIVRLLQVAWQRRLVFTIGTSATTGENSTVVWNEIHHKTEFGSNHSGHGYPDPNYLENILMELASQGVTEEDDD